MKDVTLNDIQRLTELIAAHGVYALTVIVIFYLQFWAKKNLDTASRVDHDYFRKCHASTWIATWVMMVTSTLVWIYATFVYKASTPFLHGSVMGLVDQRVMPSKAEDPAELSEQISPASRDVQLYESKQLHDSTGTYDLDWLLIPREGAPTTIVFSFQHHYKLWKPQNALIPLVSDNARPMFESKTEQRTFTIDLQALHYRLNTSLQIAYERDGADPVRNIGKLYLRREGAKVPINWEENKPAASGRAVLVGVESLNWPTFVATLHAAGDATQQSKQLQQTPVFDATGNYDSRAGRLLRERLGSADLRTQLSACAVLVAARQRSFKFVRDSLSSNEQGYDRELLMTNLARSLDEIDRDGTPAPADLNAQMATVLASSQDFDAAARFFDRAGDAPLTSPELYFTRGFAYSRAGQYEKAIKDFDRYLTSAKSAFSQALAQTFIGWCYKKLNKIDTAIERYKASMTVDPTFAMPYNNLAYLYAEQRRNLPEALKLANRALELNRDAEERANYKDTKGWILYQMGRYPEAVTLLKEAAAAAPYEAEIRRHLEQAQQTAAKATKS